MGRGNCDSTARQHRFFLNGVYHQLANAYTPGQTVNSTLGWLYSSVPGPYDTVTITVRPV